MTRMGSGGNAEQGAGPDPCSPGPRAASREPDPLVGEGAAPDSRCTLPAGQLPRRPRGRVGERAEHFLLGAYVLGGLDEADTETFATHVQRCPRCRSELVRAWAVPEALALLREPPPPGCRGLRDP